MDARLSQDELLFFVDSHDESWILGSRFHRSIAMQTDHKTTKSFADHTNHCITCIFQKFLRSLRITTDWWNLSTSVWRSHPVPCCLPLTPSELTLFVQRYSMECEECRDTAGRTMKGMLWRDFLVSPNQWPSGCDYALLIIDRQPSYLMRAADMSLN